MLSLSRIELNSLRNHSLCQQESVIVPQDTPFLARNLRHCIMNITAAVCTQSFCEHNLYIDAVKPLYIVIHSDSPFKNVRYN